MSSRKSLSSLQAETGNRLAGVCPVSSLGHFGPSGRLLARVAANQTSGRPAQQPWTCIEGMEVAIFIFIIFILFFFCSSLLFSIFIFNSPVVLIYRQSFLKLDNKFCSSSEDTRKLVNYKAVSKSVAIKHIENIFFWFSP